MSANFRDLLMTFCSALRLYYTQTSTRSNELTTIIMRSSGGLKSEEASGAAWEAARGAAIGAAKVW